MTPSFKMTPGGTGVPIAAIADLSYDYGAAPGMAPIIDRLSLDIADGSFVTLIGRSGCGKSTLLKLLAGLLRPPERAVRIAGQAVADPVPDVRYVFQDFAQSLFPWLTVRQNVEFGSRHARPADTDAEALDVDDLLGAVGLHDVADRYPHQLSGGMQQRVAIARALASSPRLLLMDEPFSAVDAFNREQLQDLVLRIWREARLTVVLVTHDVEEAIYLGQRVVVLGTRGRGVIEDVAIDLPWPRDQVATRESARYLALRRYLHGLVMREDQL